MVDLKKAAAKSAEKAEKEAEKAPQQTPFWLRSDLVFEPGGVRLKGPLIPTMAAGEPQKAANARRRQREHIPGTDYTVSELAIEWGLSADKIRQLFRNEPGVKKLQDPRASKKGKRHYTTLRIPETVAERVAKRLS